MQEVLWGKDHLELGEVVTRSVGPRAAIAITRGRHKKVYAYTDPNEDAAVAVVGPRATLLAVADGHSGWPATEAVISTVVDALGMDPPPADVADDVLVDLFHRASQAVLEVTARPDATTPDSRATLVVALIAGRRVQWASFGDSAVYTVSKAAAVPLARPQNMFVGYPMPRRAVDWALERGITELTDGEWVVAATDGFVDFARPFPTEHFAPDADAATVAEALIEAACHGGAGDNVAVAVAGP
jgi:serine/threonine protein phosphatase PrpC